MPAPLPHASYGRAFRRLLAVAAVAVVAAAAAPAHADAQEPCRGGDLCFYEHADYLGAYWISSAGFREAPVYLGHPWDTLTSSWINNSPHRYCAYDRNHLTGEIVTLWWMEPFGSRDNFVEEDNDRMDFYAPCSLSV